MRIQSEIDHRIKNNLNMISAILGLQILNLKNGSDESSEEILQKSKLRIDALVMVHDALYLGKQKEGIDFVQYVNALSEKIGETFHKILNVKIETVKKELSLETMVELGIILNELFTNSIKYGTQTIEIKLTKKYKYCVLTYLEKGNKTADVRKINESKKLGIKLIKLMVKQLRANMDIQRNGDLGYTIRFKCIHHR